MEAACATRLSNI